MVNTSIDPTDAEHGRDPEPTPHAYEPFDAPVPPGALTPPGGPPAPTYGQYGQDAQPGQPLNAGPPDAGMPSAGPQDEVWRQPQYGQQVPQWQSGYTWGPPSGQSVTASKGSRLGGYLIDCLVLAVPTFAISLVFGAVIGRSASAGEQMSDAAAGLYVFLLYVVLPIVGLVYFGYFGGVRGATIGQRAVNIKVIDTRGGGSIGFWRYVWRMVVLGVTGNLCTLGYWSIFFDGSGQDRGWHDMAGASRVVKA